MGHVLTKEDALEAEHADAALAAEHGIEGNDIYFTVYCDVDAVPAVAARPAVCGHARCPHDPGAATFRIAIIGLQPELNNTLWSTTR